MSAKNILLLASFLTLFGASAAFFAIERSGPRDRPTACTMEALLCPDGSAVGRTGPNCAFSACPDAGYLVGELRRIHDGYQMVIASPDTAPNSATYALPILLAASHGADRLVGQKVKARGTFVEGNLLRVDTLESAPPEEIGLQTNDGVLVIGETKFLSGVKITLNAVVRDNRCPVDVVCIQAGGVTANVTLVSDTDRETLDLASDGPPHGFDAFQVSIVGVRPPKVAAREPAPQSYALTFRVEPLTQ